MASLLKPSPPSDLEEIRSDSALEYYAKHTAQIEVSTPKEKNQFDLSSSLLVSSRFS